MITKSTDISLQKFFVNALAFPVLSVKHSSDVGVPR